MTNESINYHLSKIAFDAQNVPRLLTLRRLILIVDNLIGDIEAEEDKAQSERL